MKRKIGAVCFAVSMMMLVFSCIDREEVLQLEQDTASEIKSVKQWFDINKVSLNKEGSDVRAREMSKELILPFFEKEPDWSKFSEYHFRDGRKVFEIHLKNLSGIMPKRFFEEYGNSGSDLVEESLLFVEQQGVEEGFSVLVARYFSYGEKAEDMTYHKIPSGWSGRIDMFSYSERHLRSFEVDEGKIVSHITYQTEEEKKSIGRENALIVCSGYWLDFPYYGISGGVGSSASVYVTECTDVPTGGGGGGGNFGYPSNEGGGGGGSSGFGDGTGSGSSTSTPCNNTNNFSDHCIPHPGVGGGELPDSDVEGIDCASFVFSNVNGGWQETGVSGVRFKVIFIDGTMRRSREIIIPRAIYFGLPNENISASDAANFSAGAVQRASDLAMSLVKSNPDILDVTLHNEFMRFLKNQMSIKGGSAGFYPSNGYNGSVFPATFDYYGNGNC